MKLNLPNRLTLTRFVMVPFCIASVMLIGIIPDVIARIIAAAIFLFASITDVLDGRIARREGIVTNFGKFLDPIADKFMIIGTLTAITYKMDSFRLVLTYVLLITIFRELAVTSLRMVAVSSGGVVIAANGLGKTKTVCQVVCVMSLLLEPVVYLPFTLICEDFILLKVLPISGMAIIVSTFFTIWSGVDYIAKGWKFIDSSK